MSMKEVISISGIKQVLLTVFLTSIGFGIIIPILPFYSLSLGAKPFELGIIVAVFAFMSLIFSPIMGKLSDKHGRKKIILVGIFGYAISYIILAFSNSLPMVILGRAVAGIFLAAIFPACTSLLSDFTNEKQRGEVMGLFGMALSLGFMLGPAFGGLASAISIKDAFLLSALLSFANLIFVQIKLKEPAEKPESMDLAGKELSMLEHLRSGLLFLFLSSFMASFMIGGHEAIVALYTSERLGFTSAQLGIVFTYVGALVFFSRGITGKLINKFGEINLIRAGLAVSGLGFFSLLFAGDWISLLGSLTVFTLGNALIFPCVPSLITKRTTGKRGVVLGLESSFRSLGLIIGPLLGGFLYGLHHSWAFIGMALVVWIYFLIFSFAGAKKI